MIVTFIGGPLHETHVKWDDTPNRYWAETAEGVKVLYEWRCESGMGIGSNPIVYTHAIYAVFDMPEDEYRRLLEQVEMPSDL
ncbi:hypothetical protein M2650_02560 [Luteimonas sp. SX5]|uniref:Uncharacterized protein n=1 Tax=Luteimonas galliterrae TaxID=2940486 RepID=A0ABT0MH01_9GAMM|nr:hypothetical protein [Luteimonas galliterrae]MCL1633529.1 hypothetical protein [Luteimonas galliterrae]